MNPLKRLKYIYKLAKRRKLLKEKLELVKMLELYPEDTLGHARIKLAIAVVDLKLSIVDIL